MQIIPHFGSKCLKLILFENETVQNLYIFYDVHKYKAYKRASLPHSLKAKSYDNKQLLDEVEHDVMNYQNRDLC